MCGAARGAVRNAQQIKNAQQKKDRASQKQRSDFLAPRFTRPLRAGKRANAGFARPEGSFAFGVPRRLPGVAVLARPATVVRDFAPGVLALFCRCSAALFPACGPSAGFVWIFAPVACLPVLCRLRGLFFFIFRLFLPDFCLSKIFSFVAHAATGTPFSFRKENGGKEPRGASPLRTPLTAPCGQSSPLPRCWPA